MGNNEMMQNYFADCASREQTISAIYRVLAEIDTRKSKELAQAVSSVHEFVGVLIAMGDEQGR